MRCLLKSFADEKCIYVYIKCFLELGPKSEEAARVQALESVSCTSHLQRRPGLRRYLQNPHFQSKQNALGEAPALLN